MLPIIYGAFLVLELFAQIVMIGRKGEPLSPLVVAVNVCITMPLVVYLFNQ